MAEEPAYLADYVTVNERIAMFHAANEHGAIRTRCTYDDGKIVRFAACVHRGRTKCQLAEDPNLRGYCLNADGTGSAEEVRGTGYVNKTSALENCETSAAGRALAMAGIAVEKSITSREEIEQAQAERERQEREDIPEVEKVALKPSDVMPTTDAIGAEAARVVIDFIKDYTDGAGLRLIASDIHGADIGDCSTLGDAVNAVAQLTPAERERLIAWGKGKQAEKDETASTR